MAERTSAESRITVDAGMTAGVNTAAEEPPVELWHEASGRRVMSAPEDVNFWLAQGFSRTKTDPEAIASEVRAHIEALWPPWSAYLEDAKDGELIDPALQVAAHMALNLLTDACNRLHLALHRRYETAPQDQSE